MSSVSLIVPFFNVKPWFREMLDSVLAQTWPDIRLVVVNDASADGSEEVFCACEPALRRKLGRVVFLSHDRNLGASEAVNTALPFCDGDYLCCADADDVLHPESNRLKVEYLDRFPSLTLVRTNGVVFHKESGQYTEVAKPADKQVRNIFEDLLFSRTYCLNGCYMLRSSAFFSCYPDRKIPVSRQGQNMQMLLPPASLSDCGYIDENLFMYRDHRTSHSHGFSHFPDMLERKRDFEQLQLKVLPHCRCDQELWEAEIRRYWQRETEDLKKHYLEAIRRHREIRSREV